MVRKRHDGFCSCGINLVEIRGEYVCPKCGLVDSSIISNMIYDKRYDFNINLPVNSSYRKKNKGLNEFIDYSQSPELLKRALVSNININKYDKILSIMEHLSHQL
jgi:hypothetical protein